MTHLEPRLASSSSSIRLARKIVVTIAGTSIVLVGVALLVLPGPAVIVIPLGLAVLGSEFRWPNRLLHSLKQSLLRARRWVGAWVGRQRPDSLRAPRATE